MATRNQEARVQSHESSLKMAHSMIDDCKTQSSKLSADLERATADKQRFEREAQGLKAALDVCNDQLSAEKRARDAAAGEARERAGRQQADLRDARARAEKLQAELSVTAKREEEERGTLQQTRRQQAEQASYLESLLARARSDLEVAQQETKTVVAERDYLKLELANLREQVGVLEGEAGALRQSLALCEQGRQRDVEAHTVQQADLSHRVRCLEEDNRRLEGVLQKQRDMDKQAREKLTGVPVGSAVVVEQRVGNVKPILLGKKGIVIAHAVSPQGEAGALVGVCVAFSLHTQTNEQTNSCRRHWAKSLFFLQTCGFSHQGAEGTATSPRRAEVSSSTRPCRWCGVSFLIPAHVRAWLLLFFILYYVWNIFYV